MSGRPRDIRHGTEGGMKAHERRGDVVPDHDPCGCRAASRIAAAQRRKRKSVDGVGDGRTWSSRPVTVITCSQCAQVKPHKSRGLCSKCYFARPLPAARHRWHLMIRRCTNPRDAAWPRYGGRGIKVCDRWLNSFDAYYKDVGDAPPGMSLDRVNNDGDYEPGNVRWATPKQQTDNRSIEPPTHCPQGHSYDEANTHRDKLGKLHCRACGRERARARYWKLKATA